MKTVLHLTASRFVGGPERQMLGLAQGMVADTRSIFVSFSEGGRCQDLIDTAASNGHLAFKLLNDTPWLMGAAREVARILRLHHVDLMCCHGYKANLVGWLASRRFPLPIVSVAHGWTGENFKVRCYEALDKRVMRWMDSVVCVSESQAQRVRRAGVSHERIIVIRNAVDLSRFESPKVSRRQELLGMFGTAPRLVVGAAGRLSPEKGFEVLVRAASSVALVNSSVGFVIFGDGPLRESLACLIADQGLSGRFVLGGFRTDLEELLPAMDLLVLPSFTEGLPVIALEACAAQVPVIATKVGGTPEVIKHGVNGYLVNAREPDALSDALNVALGSAEWRHTAGANGRRRVLSEFTVAHQSRAYTELFQALSKN